MVCIPVPEGSGVVQGGPEERFHEGSTRVPRGLQEGCTRFCEGCTKKRGYHLSLFWVPVLATIDGYSGHKPVLLAPMPPESARQPRQLLLKWWLVQRLEAVVWLT